MDEYNPNPLVKGDRMFEHAVIVVACIAAAFLLVALSCLYRFGYVKGWNDGCLHAIENLAVGNDVEMQ